GSIAATLAPVTTLFASLSPLFLPLLPIIGGIGAAVNMVAPHVAKLMDGIQRVEVLQRRFKFLGGSAEGGEKEFNYARDIAAKMNVPTEVAANSYSQLAIAAKDSKMQGQGVRDLFEGITASLSALGLSGQDASLVFMAYTQ
ncbi:MAG: tape measure protein, partial [Sphaerospermopsis kisseleviana]